MDRLTRADVDVTTNYNKGIVSNLSDKLLDLVLNGITLNSVNKDDLRDMVRHLYETTKHYEDLEEQGLLDIRPCKGGTTAYMLLYNDNKYEVVETLVEAFFVGNKSFAYISKVDEMGCLTDTKKIAFKEFGKTVFLTHEQAEQKLKELNGVE